jgi:2-isopropylmalate synthase
MNAGTAAVCLVGKTHDFHVTEALGITLDENVENIAASVAHLVAKGREALFDAEHFFDGYKANPDYALTCLKAALDAGARWIVLCDTNGGTLPGEIGRITAEVIAAGIPGTGWASTPITTPKPPSRAASRRSRPGRGRCRAR